MEEISDLLRAKILQCGIVIPNRESGKGLKTNSGMHLHIDAFVPVALKTNFYPGSGATFEKQFHKSIGWRIAMTTSIKKVISMCTIAAASLGVSSLAHAQLTFQGVTFTPSYAGNVLTIEIDAANPTGDWEDAVGMIALQVKDIGTWTSATVDAPGAAVWTVLPNELNASGCDGGFNGIQRACATGPEVALADDMLFAFTFTGGIQDFSNPHLKLIMVDAEGNKLGELMSKYVPAIPEPSTYAMLLGGLGVLAAVRRRSKKAA